jgi:hemolysin activation/secretion protein
MKLFVFALIFSFEAIAQQSSYGMRGLILLGPHAESKISRNFEGVEAECLDLPGDLCDLQKIIEPCYFGKPLTVDLVKQVQREVILFYRDQGRPVVIVEIPPQNLTSGVLQLRVKEASVGEVVVQGNRWYGDRLLRNQIRLDYGDPVDSNRLLDDIAWLNRNPFRKSEAVFTPGQYEGTTNIELVTKDRFPLRTYVGGDNTGQQISNTTRLWAGFDWGYAFMFDQVLSYQYSCSPDFKEFQSHTVHYTAPLPWRHFLVIYGGISWTKPEIENFNSEGQNAQGSLRYEIPLKPFFNHWLQELELGFDIKTTNNILSFIGTSDLLTAEQILQNQRINISQLVLGYDIGWEVPNHKIGINAECFYSPGEILANQTEADFNQFRPFANNQYLYAFLETYYQTYIPLDFSLFFMGRFQKSSRPLIVTEQIAIGGYDTVRGYDELLFLGDNGVIGNFEWRTPETPLIGYFCNRRANDLLYFLLFYDVAYAELITPILDEPRRAFMMSTGPGMRYQIGTYFSARIDYGFKLQTVKHLGDTSMGKLHVGMLLSF